MPEIRVNDAELFYVDQGAGAPVVFVHGAWMDHPHGLAHRSDRAPV
jgi:pimeloyl-ACP methyl ester carboxylesterase